MSQAIETAELWLKDKGYPTKLAPLLIPTIEKLIKELEIPADSNAGETLNIINNQPNDYFANKKKVKFGTQRLKKPSKVLDLVFRKIRRNQESTEEELEEQTELVEEILEESIEEVGIEKSVEKQIERMKMEIEEERKQEIEEVVQESKAAEGIEFHRPGYNYMGAGTNISTKVMELKNVVPRNQLDWLALEHDFQYMSTNPDIRRIADIRFVKQVKILADAGKLSPFDLNLASKLIDAKMLLEDVSMNPIENIERLFAGVPDESKYDDFGDLSEVSRKMIARSIDAWENYIISTGYAIDKESGEVNQIAPQNRQKIEDRLTYAQKMYASTLYSIEKGDFSQADLNKLLELNPSKLLGHFNKFGEGVRGVEDIYGNDVGDVIGVERLSPDILAEPEGFDILPMEDAGFNEEEVLVENKIQDRVEEEVIQDQAAIPTAIPAGVTESTINFAADEGNKIRPSMLQAGGNSVEMTKLQDDINEKRIQEEIILANTRWVDRGNKLKINEAQQLAVRFNRSNILANMNNVHDDAQSRDIESKHFAPPTERSVQKSLNNIKKKKRVRMSYKEGRKATVQFLNMRKFGRRTGSADDPDEANGSKKLTHTIDQSHKSRSGFKPAFIQSSRNQPPVFLPATEVY